MSERKAGDVFRNNLEERIGTEEYDRISADGHQDVRKGGRISAAEATAEFRERADGVSLDDKISEYQGMVDGGQKFNNKAQSYLEKHGINFPGSSEVKDPEPDPIEPIEAPNAGNGPVTGGPVNIDTGSGDVTFNPPSAGPGKGSGGGLTVVQDNDQVSNVTGNGNTVTQNQDNSVSTGYGIGSGRFKSASSLKDQYVSNILKR